MALLWSMESKADLNRLFGFLVKKNPLAAAKAIAAIRAGSDNLLTFPEAGHPMEGDTDRREHAVPFGGGGYVLRYRITHGDVFIIRVWHTRETR
ncbi:MAG: type II toxin-antitoxin system RelE/ParE family toxin [Rhodospirillales bacterium]|jgi:plasmid stabilization system protein ParE|nr:type II toxin-antitoxin system RelE/ParE family toxin [Rhodospirillales bacterium]MBT4041283.1 type II toxin-antitoxin system RelE/ParE family toxin [Rhodospirillales bacterium]MBT4628082.1 type II toxin-antitoxin system RelE/ParE family toxin [Rhodospirillales bacterium]MBT5351731.1 type II toxin-antitoxin system RelE/ParE family toxin [Rhodospirillales bacterium]MBT5519790.1 type II toxin-antitoxin system RelE/ParE family toxin [Rhodospirillales bacterium]